MFTIAEGAIVWPQAYNQVESGEHLSRCENLFHRSCFTTHLSPNCTEVILPLCSVNHGNLILFTARFYIPNLHFVKCSSSVPSNGFMILMNGSIPLHSCFYFQVVLHLSVYLLACWLQLEPILFWESGKCYYDSKCWTALNNICIIWVKYANSRLQQNVFKYLYSVSEYTVHLLPCYLRSCLSARDRTAAFLCSSVLMISYAKTFQRLQAFRMASAIKADPFKETGRSIHRPCLRGPYWSQVPI